MSELPYVETLLQDAITILTGSGFPLAAEALRDRLRRIREAPTAGARRHRISQLIDLFDGIGAPSVAFRLQPIEGLGAPYEGMHGFRFARTEAHRLAEERYRRTLDRIRDVLTTARVA